MRDRYCSLMQQSTEEPIAPTPLTKGVKEMKRVETEEIMPMSLAEKQQEEQQESTNDEFELSQREGRTSGRALAEKLIDELKEWRSLDETIASLSSDREASRLERPSPPPLSSFRETASQSLRSSGRGSADAVLKEIIREEREREELFFSSIGLSSLKS